MPTVCPTIEKRNFVLESINFFLIILSQTFQIKWTLRYCRKQLFCSLQWIKSKGERNSVMDTDTRTLTLDVCVCMTSILPVKPPPFKSSLHSPLFSGKSNSAAAVESNKPIMTIYGQKSCSFALLWQSIKTDHLLENTGWPKIVFVHWNGYEFENDYFLSHFGEVKMCLYLVLELLISSFYRSILIYLTL